MRAVQILVDLRALVESVKDLRSPVISVARPIAFRSSLQRAGLFSAAIVSERIALLSRDSSGDWPEVVKPLIVQITETE